MEVAMLRAMLSQENGVAFAFPLGGNTGKANGAQTFCLVSIQKIPVDPTSSR
jgi:hypothetical protein